MVLDATGNLQPDLLGLAMESKKKNPTMKLWENVDGNFSLFVLVPLVTCLGSRAYISSPLINSPRCVPYLFLLSVSRKDSPLDPSKVCHLSNPHSNAFIDLDGDCLAGTSMSQPVT